MSMTLTGDKVLERRLKKLPANIQRNLARKSLRKALSFVRKDARELVPVWSKNLKKAIKTKVSLKRNGEMTGRVFIKTRGKGGAPYAHMVEWGSVKNSSSRFMTISFEKNREKIIADFRSELKLNIEKAGTL